MIKLFLLKTHDDKFNEKYVDYKCDYRTEVPQLRLGKRYSATLVDLEEEDTIASFVFTASMMIFMVMLFYGFLVMLAVTESVIRWFSRVLN